MIEDKKAGRGHSAVLEPAEDEEGPEFSGVFRRESNVGLCVNCELRETCMRLKPAGGIWFCAEYREP